MNKQQQPKLHFWTLFRDQQFVLNYPLEAFANTSQPKSSTKTMPPKVPNFRPFGIICTPIINNGFKYDHHPSSSKPADYATGNQTETVTSGIGPTCAWTGAHTRTHPPAQNRTREGAKREREKKRMCACVDKQTEKNATPRNKTSRKKANKPSKNHEWYTNNRVTAQLKPYGSLTNDETHSHPFRHSPIWMGGKKKKLPGTPEAVDFVQVTHSQIKS